MPVNDDIKLIKETVAHAGAIAMEFFDRSIKQWEKSDGSPVTEADIAVDKYLRETLLNARPDYGWLSEETKDDPSRLEKRRVWIVDPIDGTSSFIKKNDEWSISVGLVEDGKPVLGAVLQPATSDFYFGQKGSGASLNERKIAVDGTSALENSSLIARPGLLQQSRWQKTWPDLNRSIVVSLALRICKVAAGAYDGTINRGNESEWDTAAADIVITEAGGCLTGFNGEQLLYNKTNPKLDDGLIAGNPTYHRLLQEQTRHFIKQGT